MRLIDADALKTYEQLEPMGNGNYKSVLIVYKKDIEAAPTIKTDIKCEDCKTITALKAVLEPVIRCRDCRFYTEEERWCRWLGLCGAFDPNDYCSHAEEGSEE